MILFCWDCHKTVANVPDDTIFRATATCPECEAKKPEAPLSVARMRVLQRCAGYWSKEQFGSYRYCSWNIDINPMYPTLEELADAMIAEGL